MAEASSIGLALALSAGAFLWDSWLLAVLAGFFWLFSMIWFMLIWMERR